MADILSDAAITAALGRHMTQAVERQAVAVGNLANLDTPGYHSKEIRFSDALDEELGAAGLTTTDPRHLGGTVSDAPPSILETANLPLRRDGNNVQMDRELLNLTQAASDFSAAQTVLAAKFRLVRYAINEGR